MRLQGPRTTFGPHFDRPSVVLVTIRGELVWKMRTEPRELQADAYRAPRFELISSCWSKAGSDGG